MDTILLNYEKGKKRQHWAPPFFFICEFSHTHTPGTKANYVDSKHPSFSAHYFYVESMAGFMVSSWGEKK